jgi:hypothetical protein
MATMHSLARTMAYLVSYRSDSTRAISLTTGTFNLVVKDRFAFPPERRVFSPGRILLPSLRSDGQVKNPSLHNPPVLETYKSYRSAGSTVNLLHSQHFHRKCGC